MESKIELKKREQQTLNRFVSYHDASVTLLEFFKLGFSSFESLKSIVAHYSEIEISEKSLWDYWNFKKIEDYLTKELESVLTKISK